ncbi:MAG: peptidoglycan-binding protein [Pedobacter sp.]|nr:MAG: peptidoglycan-binding protein [Pedobacter sp.]
MYTIRLLLGMLCLVNLGSYGLFAGHSLTKRKAITQQAARMEIINIARTQLSVRESGGNNRGPEVNAYLAYVGLAPGAKWCAAFVSWVYGKAGYVEPRNAWSPSLFPQRKRVTAVQTGDLFGIHYPALGRIAHCGIVESLKGDWLIGIEGNTSLAGSRDGDGVRRKRRHVKTIAVYADWISRKGGSDE